MKTKSLHNSIIKTKHTQMSDSRCLLIPSFIP